jgi:hypothetical protein
VEAGFIAVMAFALLARRTALLVLLIVGIALLFCIVVMVFVQLVVRIALLALRIAVFVK